jgi:transposase-like protein
MPRRNGRHRPRIPVNIVYRSIQAMGGPTAVCRTLDISLPTLARWRRAGRVGDARAVLEWAALLHAEPAQQLALARALAGLRRDRARAK